MIIWKLQIDFVLFDVIEIEESSLASLQFDRIFISIVELFDVIEVDQFHTFNVMNFHSFEKSQKFTKNLRENCTLKKPGLLGLGTSQEM